MPLNSDLAFDRDIRWLWAGLGIAVLISAILICGQIVQAPPSPDEALVAVPAWNLAHHGFPGTTTLVEEGIPWKGINRRTYNTLPGGILYLTPWFAVFPGTILVMRTAFALWGVVLLGASFFFLHKLTGSRETAILATILMALDYHFILGTAQGRVDVMTAGLGMTSLASYCGIRLRSLKYAALVSATLAVCACLTHPEGLLFVGALLIVAIGLDGRALSPIYFAYAAIPFALCGALWLLYVAQDPGAAHSQLKVNVLGQGRLPPMHSPLRAVRRELLQRYLATPGFAVGGADALKLLRLLIYWGGFLFATLTPTIRPRRGIRILMSVAAGMFLVMAVFENSKFGWYLVHISLFYYALGAAAVVYSWRPGIWRRSFVALAAAVFLLINPAGAARRMEISVQTGGFPPAQAFLLSRLHPQDVVIGHTSFWFGFPGPERKLFDDSTLGVRSGLSPDYVFDHGYDEIILKHRTDDPALYAAIQARLAQLELIYDYRDYKIYRRIYSGESASAAR